jgi:hypothetical protein
MNGFIYKFYRSDTNGATRPVNQVYLRRQQLLKVIFHDGMGLPTANFHDGP